MLALTLWRPWDETILFFDKDLENRPWRPPDKVIGTTVALHAGLVYDEDAARKIQAMGIKLMHRVDSDARAGHIVGTAKVTGFYDDSLAPKVISTHSLSHTRSADFVKSSRWWSGPVAWFLDDRRPLKTLIACRGHQRLWQLPDDIATRIRNDMEAA